WRLLARFPPAGVDEPAATSRADSQRHQLSHRPALSRALDQDSVSHAGISIEGRPPARARTKPLNRQRSIGISHAKTQRRKESRKEELGSCRFLCAFASLREKSSFSPPKVILLSLAPNYIAKRN